MMVNLEAEQEVLGTILRRDTTLEEVRDILTADMFANAVHADIWTAICTLADAGKKVTSILIKRHFEDDRRLNDVGGAQYLVRLEASAIGYSIEDHAKQIRFLHVCRKLHDLSGHLDGFSQGIAANVDATEDIIFEHLEECMSELRAASPASEDMPTFSELCDTSWKAIEDAADGNTSVGIKTGLQELDSMTGGPQPEQLIILAGRPKMGKTLLATNMALGMAREGHGVAFCSQEMSAHQLMVRMYTDEAEKRYGKSIPYQRVLQGKIDDYERNILRKVRSELGALPVAVNDHAGMTTPNLRYWLKRQRRLWDKQGIELGCCIVDYMQLLTPGDRYTGNKVAEVSEISRQLKMTAKELHIPLIALSQLSRSVESREDKRPVMSDLRESGAIEQDADVIMLCYREAYYKRNSLEGMNKMSSEYDIAVNELNDLEGKMEVIVAAQRMGPTGTATLSVDLACGAIRSRGLK